MTCPIRTEGQEYVCGSCGVRWDFGDEAPACQTREPSTSWKPCARLELAARFRRVPAAQVARGYGVIGITPALARDLLAELERRP